MDIPAITPKQLGLKKKKGKGKASKAKGKKKNDNQILQNFKKLSIDHKQEVIIKALNEHANLKNKQ